MPKLDLNLLHALAALLREESVVGASRRLNITASATSRALARLREVTGDPLLVRAGRGLALSPRAAELKQQLPPLMDQLQSLLGPGTALDLARLERLFTIRCREGFAETFGPPLVQAITRAAPRCRLAFVQKTDKGSAMLRDGLADLETGVVSGRMGPEVRSRGLFEDRYVAILSPIHRHTLPLTAEAFRRSGHIGLHREEVEDHFFEQALQRAEIEESPAALVTSYGAAIALARQSEMIAIVPAIHSQGLQTGVAVSELPFETPTFTVSLLWHPRLEADPAHRWLRAVVAETVQATLGRLHG